MAAFTGSRAPMEKQRRFFLQAPKWRSLTHETFQGAVERMSAGQLKRNDEYFLRDFND